MKLQCHFFKAKFSSKLDFHGVTSQYKLSSCTANNMVLNLTKLNTDPNTIKKDGYTKIVDAVQDSRNNYNTLIDAMTHLSQQLDDISKKLDLKADSDVVDTVKEIQETSIPALKTSISKNKALSEARTKDACSEVSLQHEQLEAHGRRLNIIWNGRKEEKQTVRTQWGGTRVYEDTEKLFREFLVQSLRLEPEYVASMIIRDCHRLPKSRDVDGPPPIIAALICQRHRNDILAAAKNLQGTPFSIKSDLPKRLNTLRKQMLKVRSDLKKKGKIVRLIEIRYLPSLQQRDANLKWSVIYDVNGPKNIPNGLPDVEPVEDVFHNAAAVIPVDVDTDTE